MTTLASQVLAESGFNSTSEPVYMFKKSNQYRYLVGHFDRKKGETDSQFLDRVAKEEGVSNNRPELTLE